MRLVSAATLFFAGIVDARADVNLLFSPEPVVATRALGIRAAGVWAVRACNSADSAVTLAPERLFQAAPDLPFLDLDTAAMVLQQSHVRHTRVRIARYLEGAVVLATVLTGGGVIAAAPRVLVALSLSASAAHQMADMIQGVAPDMGILNSKLLSAPITLAPGGCDTRLALSGVVPDAKPVNAVLK